MNNSWHRVRIHRTRPLTSLGGRGTGLLAHTRTFCALATMVTGAAVDLRSSACIWAVRMSASLGAGAESTALEGQGDVLRAGTSFGCVMGFCGVLQKMR